MQATGNFFSRSSCLLTRLVALSRLHSEESRFAMTLSTAGSLDEDALADSGMWPGIGGVIQRTEIRGESLGSMRTIKKKKSCITPH